MKVVNKGDCVGIVRNVLDVILSAIVKYPECISISESCSKSGVIFYEVNAHKSDYGRIIGRNGHTFDLINLLMKKIASNHGIVIDIRIPNRK
jgi:predicted RNA-binding protein YlqC (UPF0109 family)